MLYEVRNGRVRRMDAGLYLSALKKAYSKNFDLTDGFLAGGKAFDLYGRFASTGEKYVLVKKAKLWEVQNFEHMLAFRSNDFSPEDLQKLRQLIDESLEPDLVRGGEKYPPENHMMTYLTIVVLSEKGFSEETRKAVKKFSYAKDYLFSFRGRMETHIYLVDLTDGTVTYSRAGKDDSKTFTDIYKACRKKEEEGEKK